MASNTTRFGLLKKDPAVDGLDTFNIKTMLNDNWDKIDTTAETVQGAQDKADAAKAAAISTAATDASSKAATAEQNAKDASIPRTEKGVANGVATVGADGLLTPSQFNGKLLDIQTGSYFVSVDVVMGNTTPAYATVPDKRYYEINLTSKDVKLTFDSQVNSLIRIYYNSVSGTSLVSNDGTVNIMEGVALNDFSENVFYLKQIVKTASNQLAFYFYNGDSAEGAGSVQSMGFSFVLRAY